ncbi:MAG TPA: hypothetical protein VF556_08770 [Pyrinomonadaceae bacterium]|jgi:uncharacterized membrane protein
MFEINPEKHVEGNKNLWFVAFLAIGCLYLFARFWNLTASCLVFDEIFSVHASSLPWNELFKFIALDLIHPPFFYIVLKIWTLLGGESLLWLRLFPVCWSVLAIAPFLLFCRELKLENREMLFAFIFIAVNGSLIKYAQGVRMYSLLFCLGHFSLWLFVKFLEAKSKTVLFWLFFVNFLLIYTHYFGWLIIAAELAAVAIYKFDKLKSFLLLLALWIAGFLPWAAAVYFASKTGTGFGQNLGWAGKPGIFDVALLILTIHEPFYWQQSNIAAASLWFLTIPLALICLAAIVLNWKNSKIRFLAIFVFLPISFAFIISHLFPFSVWGVRHLIITVSPYALLSGIALNKIHLKSLKIGAFCLIGVLIIIGGAVHFTRKTPNFIWCAWENLAVRATETDKSNKITIYAFEDLVAYHIWFATKDDESVDVVSIKNYPGIEEDKQYFLPRGFEEVKTANPDAIAGERFWIAFRDRSWKPDHPLIQDLTTRGYKLNAPLEIRAQGLSAFLVLVEK